MKIKIGPTRPLDDTPLHELLLMRTMFQQMHDGTVSERIVPLLDERIHTVKENEEWRESKHQKIAEAIVNAAKEWETSRFGKMFFHKRTWESIGTLLKHRREIPELLKKESAFWNTAEAQEIAAFAMSLTSLKVFTGGVGEEENLRTARKSLKRGDGVIIDVPAKEKYDTPPDDKVFDEVVDMYLKAIDLCDTLKKEFPKGKIAAAFKLSTVANFADLERISQKITEYEKGDKTKVLNLGDGQVLYDKILARMEKFLASAAEKGVDAYVDAEESVINPAINHMCFACLEKTAREEKGRKLRPIITVQAYLKDSEALVDRILAMDEASRPNIKLVRGAYIGAEHQPRGDIWEAKKKTDEHYDHLLEKIYKVIVATHNQTSRDIAAELKREGMDRGNTTEMEFASLMGVGANRKPVDPKLGITEMKYQPALLTKLASAVLEFMAYFTRRGKEFMKQEGQDGKSRAAEELEAINWELEERGYSMDFIDVLQENLNNFIMKQLDHVGAPGKKEALAR